MKKYLSVLVVLTVVFIGVKNVTAEENDVYVGGSGGASIDGGAMNRGSLLDTKMKAKLQLDAKMKAKNDIRDGQKGEDKNALTQEDVDAMKDESKEKREEMHRQAQTLRDEAKLKMQILKENFKKEKDRVKAKIKEDRVVGRENALARFDKAVEILTNAKTRIETQLPKVAELDIDITVATSNMAEVGLKIESAKLKIAEAHAILASSSSELSAENKTKLKVLAQDTQTLFKEAHGLLVDTVKLLKDAVKIKRESVNIDATGTKTTN